MSDKFSHAEIAEALLNEGDYSAAEKEFKKACKAGELDLNGKCRHLEAKALVSFSSENRAELRELQKINTTEPALTRVASIIAFQNKEYKLTLSKLVEYLKLAPADTFAYGFALEAARRSRSWKKLKELAEQYFEYCQEEKKANDLFYLALFHISKREDDEARQVLNQALELDDKNANCLAALARLDCLTGRYEAAAENLRKTFAIDQGNEFAQETLIINQKGRSPLLAFIYSMLWYLYIVPRLTIERLRLVNLFILIVLALPILFLWTISELALFALRLDRKLESQMPVKLLSQNAYSLPVILFLLSIFYGPSLLKSDESEILERQLAPPVKAISREEQLEKDNTEEKAITKNYDQWLDRGFADSDSTWVLVDYELRKKEKDELRLAYLLAITAESEIEYRAEVLYKLALNLAEKWQQENLVEYLDKRLTELRSSHTKGDGPPPWLGERLNK